ncbi:MULTISPECIES: conjugal transfer protein TraG [Sphingomonadales]|jgi:type IV secretion system protein VirD4|uniref:conjugal transfer protein TraG n=1 Tax=Sphingomonadales TaxID=204457 RepID=UPI000830D1D1|nr:MULTISPECIES: conjugal transfer protein TraG [Sphingomonadales]MCH4892355.1 IncP-type conjugal transfer protein TraG [Sphingomonas sp. SFZ2018-12]RQW39677.1 conjugal transfer protein TraG [Novosphingobium sp. LASN5T]
MSAAKILWGQILAVLIIIVASVWSATQWTASALGFQPELGAPWFRLFGHPVYRPYDLFWWWFSYDAYAPQIFDTGGMIATLGGFLAIVVAIAMSVWRGRENRNANTYGTARWATRDDIRKAGLLADSGVVLGQFQNNYLRHDGAEHVLCFAPTRSGKGVGLVIPTLLTWSGSAIVHDIKGENWDVTAGFRSTFSRTLRFDPTSLESSAYNPLLEVRRGLNEVRDVQNIADILVDPEGSLEKRNHWEKTSHALLVGAVLHVLYAGADKSLAGVAAFLSNPDETIENTLYAMMDTPHLGEAGPHPVVASAARELLNKSDNERSGVLSTAMSFLGLYRDPVIAKVTSHSDWRIADLTSGRPTSLYLVVPPSDISRTKPLIRLILNQIGRRLTEEFDPATKRQRVLLMLDEFPALGRLDFFESALAFMAGYGLKAFLIAQSLNQIERAYGQNNAILDNCHVRVAFATNDERTAKRVSEALGTTTEQRSMKNYAGHRLSPWLGHLMISRSETARALLTPGEILQLPQTDEVVLSSGAPPIKAKKARYYADRRLQSRVLPAPENCGQPAEARATDDWSALPPIEPDPKSSEDGSRRIDPANGGLRREPDLPEHVEVVARPKSPAAEFDFAESDGADTDQSAANNDHIRRTMERGARQASLDLGDGIEL